MARPGLGVRGGVRPADRADADGADPIAADLLQYEPDRHVPVPVVVDRAHHLRPAAGDLAVAQLPVRGARRPDRGGPGRRGGAGDGGTTHPAIASYAIFQFLWVWNDLLVGLTFSGGSRTVQPLTVALAALTGSRGQDWHLLTAGAFVSIIIPLIVFFALQRYFVRGLLAGSVKG